MKKQEKPAVIENLKEDFKKASSTTLVNYTGLSVKAQQDLKKRLKAVGAKMFITKNTLFKIAAKEEGFPEETMTDTVLSGPTALIITEGDPIAPIQILAKFAKEFEIPSFKVGVVEGKYYDKVGLTTLAKLPSKEVLFAQVVGSVSSPLYGVVGTLQGNLSKLVYILKAKSQAA